MRQRSHDEETLANLLAALWAAKWFLLAGAVIGIIGAAVIMAAATPFYRAQMLVGPVKSLEAPGDDERVNARDPDAETMEFEHYIQVLNGPAVLRNLLTSEPELMAALSRARRFGFQAPYEFSGAEALAAWMQDAVSIQPVGASPLRRIVFEHPDRQVAKEVLINLHATADAMIRADILQRTQARLQYLETALSETGNPDHRRALTNLLMEQERLKMMLRMDRNFAANLAEPPYVSPRPVWPRETYIFAVMILAGMIAGWLVYGVKDVQSRCDEQNTA